MALAFLVGFRHQLGRGRACAVHAHRDWEFVYHPSGSGSTSVGGAVHGFAPGDLVAYPPGVAHDQTMEAAGEDWIIQVRGFAAPAGLEQTAWVAALAGDAAIAGELAWLTGGLAKAMQHVADLRAAAVIASALTCVRVASPATARDLASELAERAGRLAAERGHLLPGVEALARELGVSPHWLRHACARAGAEAPLRLLIRARLERAQVLLRHTPQPLAVVAAQSGFRDARALLAVCRRELGCTPGQVRASAGY